VLRGEEGDDEDRKPVCSTSYVETHLAIQMCFELLIDLGEMTEMTSAPQMAVCRVVFAMGFLGSNNTER